MRRSKSSGELFRPVGTANPPFANRGHRVTSSPSPPNRWRVGSIGLADSEHVHRGLPRRIRWCTCDHRVANDPGFSPELTRLAATTTIRRGADPDRTAVRAATIGRSGAVAQLARAPALQAGGQGFDSPQLHSGGLVEFGDFFSRNRPGFRRSRIESLKLSRRLAGEGWGTRHRVGWPSSRRCHHRRRSRRWRSRCGCCGDGLPLRIQGVGTGVRQRIRVITAVARA